MPITVNWSDLEIAFERNSPDQESFLDLENGDLLSIVEGEPDAAARRARVASNPERYLRIDPASSREQYRWMERFVSSVSDQPLRERLLIAIDGKGAFRRFKDVLLAFPAERERWFAYRSELLHFHIQTWLDHMRIEVANAPPWGHVAQPAEPAEIPRVVPSGEAPGEILRRQARDLLDEIPAAELPPALAFLEFLRDRGPSSLLGAAVSPRRPPRSTTTTTTTTRITAPSPPSAPASRGRSLDPRGPRDPLAPRSGKWERVRERGRQPSAADFFCAAAAAARAASRSTRRAGARPRRAWTWSPAVTSRRAPTGNR